MTITIIVICVGLEVLRYLNLEAYWQVANQLVFAPSIGLTEPYRFLTSTFLHGGWMHLAFNMYALWLIGSQLEQVLGRARFTTLYVLSALGGSVGYLAIAGVGAPGAVGASGGVFGLFGAFAILMRRLGRDPRPVLIIIGINVVLGFVISNIAWQAHLGGLVIGALTALIFARVPLRRAPAGATRPGNQSGPTQPGLGYPGPGTSQIAVSRGLSGAALQWLLCGAVLALLVAITAVVYAVS